MLTYLSCCFKGVCCQQHPSCCPEMDSRCPAATSCFQVRLLLMLVTVRVLESQTLNFPLLNLEQLEALF